MSQLNMSRLTSLHHILLGAAALSLAVPADALARVGITSAAEGDPLGKPPAEAERVLRVGIDVQADEVITTGANDRAHLVFLDGTALTVGPEARMVIDRFVYDPSTTSGELSITVSKGVLRLVGGKISKTRPVVINTPTSYVGIRGGISIVDAQPAQTISTFMFGKDMTVTGQGQTQIVTRPGFEVTTRSNAPPGLPAPISEAALSNLMAQLEGRSGRGGAPTNSPTVVKITQGTQGLASQPQQSTPANAGNGQTVVPQPASWQQWGGGVAYQNTSAINPALTGQNTSAINPPLTGTALVPGSIPTYMQLPITGTATYNGSFSATDSNSRPFGGTMSIGWNFASQSGSLAAVANGQNGNTGSATGPLRLTPGTANFSGSFSVSGGGGFNGSNSGTVNGNFVSTSSSPVGAVRGTFSGNGGGGSGSFNATK